MMDERTKHLAEGIKPFDFDFLGSKEHLELMKKLEKGNASMRRCFYPHLSTSNC